MNSSSSDTPPHPAHCLISFDDLNSSEALDFLRLLSEDPIRRAGGLPSETNLLDSRSTEQWQVHKDVLPLMVYFIYRKMMNMELPPKVTESLVAAIGEPEYCTRGHLFAMLRLLNHHRGANYSLTPICTEYIRKKSFVAPEGHNQLMELTASQSAPSGWNEMAPPPAKRRRMSESAAMVDNIVNPTEAQLSALHTALSLQEDTRSFADPDCWQRLPFPFIYSHLPHHRFNFESVTADGIHLYNTFKWMGREVFPQLVDAVDELRTDGTASPAAFLLGAIGVGKSHLLATLAICLRVAGKVVVYIPDCADLISSPVQYMGAALLCAFSGSDSDSQQKRQQIRSLVDLPGIETWCRSQSASGTRFYFLVDQLNALESQENSMVTNAARECVRSLLLSLYANHICVRGSSANDREGYKLLGRPQRERVIRFHPALTEREISSWMNENRGKIPLFSSQELAFFNDYVGGIFIYYPSLLSQPNLLFSEAWTNILQDPILQATRRDIWEFYTHIVTNNDKSAIPNYLAGVRAFLTGKATTSIRQDLIDHRYCFTEEAAGDCGRVTSELVRRELFAILEEHDRNVALSTDWLDDGLSTSSSGSNNAR